MTYSDAQSLLIAFGKTFSLSSLQGHSLSTLISRIIVAEAGISSCPGSALDNFFASLLGVTYAQAQANLLALGHSYSLTGLEGRSLTGLLARLLVSPDGANVCHGSTFDAALATALGITG